MFCTPTSPLYNGMGDRKFLSIMGVYAIFPLFQSGAEFRRRFVNVKVFMVNFKICIHEKK